jgi:hypothetical protein
MTRQWIENRNSPIYNFFFCLLYYIQLIDEPFVKKYNMTSFLRINQIRGYIFLAFRYVVQQQRRHTYIITTLYNAVSMLKYEWLCTRKCQVIQSLSELVSQ